MTNHGRQFNRVGLDHRQRLGFRNGIRSDREPREELANFVAHG